jgi:hypothetical protein
MLQVLQPYHLVNAHEEKEKPAMSFMDPHGLLDDFTLEEKQEYVDQGLAHFDENGGFHEEQVTDEEAREFYDSLDTDFPDDLF